MFKYASAAGAVLICLVGLPAGAVPPLQEEDAVALQINTAHSGSMDFAAGFAAPLVKLWSKKLAGSPSYPLIAEGKVFVVINGNDLFALDTGTGHRDWEHLLSDSTLGGAYDNGQLFFVNFDGLMTALKARNGKQAWSAQMVGQYAFSSPPIAVDGQVFTGGAGSGGTLYGVDEKTGHINWTQNVENGDDSSPAYGDGGLYVSYPCQYYKFSPAGTSLWHYSGDCEGGGGSTPTYFNKRVYINDWANGNFVLDSKKGSIVGTYSGGAMPAFFTGAKKRGYGLTLTDGKLFCFDVKTGNVAWSFTANSLSGAPIVVNGQPVIGADDGNVYMLDGAKGTTLWNGKVASGVTSLAAGENILVATTGDGTVTAFAPQ